MESGPPDTAQSTGVPAGGKAQRSSRSVGRKPAPWPGSSDAATTATFRSAGHWLSRGGCHPLDSLVGLADLIEAGKVGRVLPNPVQQSGATVGLHGGDERLALGVLGQFGLQPD